jgi:tetratricopeptide (TPR) repeat protein
LDYFAIHYPLEVKRRRIDLINADLMLKEEYNISTALSLTSLAKYENPLGFNELNAWGRCLVRQKDYVQALFAFESALLLEPYDVNTIENIGYCYRCLGDFYQKREEKENYWKKALRYYEDAKEVLKERAPRVDKDSFDYTQQYLSIHYALGRCYQDLSDYGNAISNFDLAREFCRSDYPNDTFYWNFWFYTLRMAEAYLSKRDHYASEY